ncbi:MAG: hypothetical protein Q8K79_00085 [Solirubrobacteraceae bacterium]|nr:hypothetical protein [Solirubrobacteraceae bacterium]
MANVRQRRTATFTYGFFEVFAYDSSRAGTEAAGDDIQHAIEEGTRSRRSVGLAGDAAVLFMPEQYSGEVELEVVEYDAEPPLTLDEVDVCVEFDLNLPSGEIVLEEPANDPVPIANVTAGRYRLRWHGLGFDGLEARRSAAEDDEDAPRNPDHYRLELWQTSQSAPPRQHRGGPNTGT